MLVRFAPKATGVAVDPPVAPNVKVFGPSAGFAPKGLGVAVLFPVGCCVELDDPKPEKEGFCGAVELLLLAAPKLNEKLGLSLFCVAVVAFEFDAPKLVVPPKIGFGVSADFVVEGAEPKADEPAVPNGLGAFDVPVVDPKVLRVADAPVPPEANENFGALDVFVFDAVGVDELEVFPTLAPNTLLLLCCCTEESEGVEPNVDVFAAGAGI